MRSSSISHSSLRTITTHVALIGPPESCWTVYGFRDFCSEYTRVDYELDRNNGSTGKSSSDKRARKRCKVSVKPSLVQYKKT